MESNCNHAQAFISEYWKNQPLTANDEKPLRDKTWKLPGIGALVATRDARDWQFYTWPQATLCPKLALTSSRSGSTLFRLQGRTLRPRAEPR